LKTFGSQVWDTSFAIQALLATDLIDEIGPALAKGHDFIEKSQVCLTLMTSICYFHTASFQNKESKLPNEPI